MFQLLHLSRLAAVTGQVESSIGHDGDRLLGRRESGLRVEPGALNGDAAGFELIGGESEPLCQVVLEQAFGHRAAAGVAGAYEHDMK